jgi:tRNA(Ile)-lysidine synthetase-like protein
MEQEFLRANPELKTDQKVLLAVSTGVDSMVLLHLVEKLNVTIGVIHIDHQLRPESKIEAEFLQSYCKSHHLPLYTKVWEQPAEKNVEAEARKVRYNFFEAVMKQEKYDLLLTAHHGDDQLETLLMRLTRGGSFTGHSGIVRKQSFGTGVLLRPLLDFSKEEIYSYAEKEQVIYFEDATNQSLDYFRNRIRNNVIPELKKENPKILLHAQQFHQQLIWAGQLIEEALKENLRNIEFDGQRGSFSYDDMPSETNARYYFLSAFFQKMEEQTQIIVSQRQLFSLLDQMGHPVSQWSIDIGEGWRFVRRYQRFYFEKSPAINDEMFSLDENEQFDLPDSGRITLRKSENEPRNDAYHVPLPLTAKLPLRIRHRRAGDRIQLTESLSKRVNRYFIDKKIATDERDRAWVVEDAAGEIVALLPFVNSYLSITTETDRIHYILDYTPQVAK